MVDNRLTEHRIDRGAIVEMPREVDYYIRDQVWSQLSTLLDAGLRRLVVDMSGTVFCDSSGLVALMRVRQRAEESGCSLVLVTPHLTVCRAFEMAGADTLFERYSSVHEALTATSGAPH
ncbi:STAS domain-containing protein [Salinactinospora qingdaonensis]|uniref:STAS domain-containing protein n=1 Tax=Salinactinospora qingdaonensis TaxID=702744 RepID=A0ABP7GE13_9ACTN